MRKIEKTIEDYKYYVCPICLHQLQDCHCELFNYELIWIDKSIQEHIRILNQKGYATRSCCEGHVDNKCTQIVFIESFPFINLPDGFKMKNTLLYYDYREKTEANFERKKQIILQKLLDWINSLPAIK